MTRGEEKMRTLAAPAVSVLRLVCLFALGSQLVLVLAVPAVGQVVFGPAPSGDPIRVAGKMISDAEHPCPTLRSAVRLSDGSIRAVCSNGETYRLSTLN